VTGPSDGTTGRELRAGSDDDSGRPARAARPDHESDWPESVRVVGSQPSLWWDAPGLAPEPGRRAAAVRAAAVRAVASPTMVAELAQSFYLMGLMALVMSLFVGLGLLAVRVLV
jgi:hypothetical protein